MKPLIVADRVFEKHNPGAGHPERPERVSVLVDMIEREDFIKRFEKVILREAEEDDILLCHSETHLKTIKETEGKRAVLDPDTSTSSESYRTALLAVGTCLNMIDEFVKSKARKGFAVIRPPGHHAERDRAMGFCLFNNVAICAEYAIKKGVERVAIVDWDLHHGNGTQRMFWEREDVLYISLHRYPYYPGTGSVREVGAGKGKGKTVNLPLPGGCGNEEYVWCFEKIVVPILYQFNPDLLLVSAGFDSHVDDPLGDMRVTEEGFGYFALLLDKFCEESDTGGPFYLLEGGYSLTGLVDSVREVLKVLAGEEVKRVDGRINDSLKSRLVKEISQYWEL